jgi:hypothetical protein
MNQEKDTTILCSYCFEYSPTGERECPLCGAPLPLDSPVPGEVQTIPQELTLEEQIEKSHQDLIQAGTRAAELAFGVGCTLGVIIGGAMIAILYLIFRTLTYVVVSTLILAMISFLVSSYLSSRAREATTRATYKREVAPEINQFIDTQGFSQVEFYEKAAETLPEDSPLLVYLSKQEAF